MKCSGYLAIAWWLYVLLRVYCQPGIPVARNLLTYTFLLLLFFGMRFLFSRCLVVGKHLENLLLVAVVCEMLLGFWQLYSGKSLHALYPITGSFLNPGPYAAFIAMGIVMALKKQYVISLVVVSMGCMLLTIARSRGAILAVALVMAYINWDKIRRYKWGLLPLAILVGGALFYFKFASGMGRLLMWYVSLKSCFSSFSTFLIGSGIGSFQQVYGMSLHDLFLDAEHIVNWAKYADVTDYAFCDILQLFVEQGIVGVILCCIIVFQTLLVFKHKRDGLLYPFVAILIYSLCSYPFQLLPFQVLGVLFVAKATAEEKSQNKVTWKIVARGILIVFLGVICGKIGMPYYKANQQYGRFAGISHASFIPEYYKLLPYCEENPKFLFTFAKVLQENDRYLDSNDMLRRGTKVSNDPMFFVLMGNNYEEMGFMNNAVKCYDEAYSRLPNRIYPLYQKMLLLDSMKDKRCNEVALKIIKAEPKVPSHAVEDMKKKAMSLLQSMRKYNYKVESTKNKVSYD